MRPRTFLIVLGLAPQPRVVGEGGVGGLAQGGGWRGLALQHRVVGGGLALQPGVVGGGFGPPTQSAEL